MVVRYPSNLPTTSGGSTPPYPCIYMPKNAYDQIWTNLDNVYVYAWVGGGVDPPEVVGKWDEYLTTT